MVSDFEFELYEIVRTGVAANKPLDLNVIVTLLLRDSRI